MTTRIRASFRTCIQIPCRSFFVPLSISKSSTTSGPLMRKKILSRVRLPRIQISDIWRMLTNPSALCRKFPECKILSCLTGRSYDGFFVCSKRTQPSTSALTHTLSIFGGFTQPNKCLNFLGLIIVTPTACCAACLCPRMGADDTESLRSHTVCQFGRAFFVLH